MKRDHMKKGSNIMVNIKKYLKYLIVGGFIGLTLIYLHFKKVDVKEFVSKKKDPKTKNSRKKGLKTNGASAD